MLPRHANELLKHLEDTADVGCSVVRRNLLLHWYGQQRLTVGIWRDLYERWMEVVEQSIIQDKKVKLFMFEGDGVITFLRADGLTTDETRFKSIGDLVGLRQMMQSRK